MKDDKAVDLSAPLCSDASAPLPMSPINNGGGTNIHGKTIITSPNKKKEPGTLRDSDTWSTTGDRLEPVLIDFPGKEMEKGFTPKLRDEIIEVHATHTLNIIL